MKNALLKALADGKGRLLSLTTGFVTAKILAWIASAGITLDPKDELYITGLAGLVIAYGIDALFIRLQTAGVKEIQDALPPSVKSDGVPGSKTIKAVENAVDKANYSEP